jgi:hypothetical protein
VQRFADVMARRTGQGDLPFSDAALAELQREILGDRTTITHFGMRQSPVFVGETVHYQEVVHYVAPPVDEIAAMLDGLQTFLERTQGQSPTMRSAVIPEPVILPVSAVITDDAGERRGYDRVLDEVSKPLIQAVREQIVFEPVQTTYQDGVVSNFAFHGADQARPLWRYPDLGPHVVFLSNVIGRTLTEQMRAESRYLRSHARARAALKEVVEMPDQQADRVLRSLEQNRGELSNVLAKEMPVLRQRGVWAEIVEAVTQAFQD